MDPEDKPARPERERTDESLRIERENADRVLAEREAAIAERADVVVDQARETADASLHQARTRADLALSQPVQKPQTREALARERAVEDDTLRKERAMADENLRREREEHARALAKLLPIERDKTDRYLLTERIRSDEALSHRDDFLSIVSHDLRNLLSGIVMSAMLVSDSISAAEVADEAMEGAKRIQRYAARMNRLIGDLVDVTSVDAGQLAVTKTAGDLVPLVDEAVDMFKPAATSKGIALTAEFAEPSLAAVFDHDRMMQVFANLITNAIKFTASGGKIAVRIERAEGELRFSVSDTGMGIPATMLDAVFDRFWQVGKNDRRGLGLGLYISRCIIEAHGGKIWAESKLGEGSQFHFTLPVE